MRIISILKIRLPFFALSILSLFGLLGLVVAIVVGSALAPPEPDRASIAYAEELRDRLISENKMMPLRDVVEEKANTHYCYYYPWSSLAVPTLRTSEIIRDYINDVLQRDPSGVQVLPDYELEEEGGWVVVFFTPEGKGVDHFIPNRIIGHNFISNAETVFLDDRGYAYSVSCGQIDEATIKIYQPKQVTHWHAQIY